jgi:hypothetical protein
VFLGASAAANYAGSCYSRGLAKKVRDLRKNLRKFMGPPHKETEFFSRPFIYV